MTLAQLSITVALLAGLGLIASRIGLSAIPAYLLSGLLLGPNEPKVLRRSWQQDRGTSIAETSESRLSAPAIRGVKAHVSVSPLPVIEIRCLVTSGSAAAIVVKVRTAIPNATEAATLA